MCYHNVRQTTVPGQERVNLILENEANRVREEHWGPRTLDLDILLYDDLVTTDEELIIPHPEMHKRSFVLEPLNQIAPNVVHPLLNKRIRDLL